MFMSLVPVTQAQGYNLVIPPDRICEPTGNCIPVPPEVNDAFPVRGCVLLVDLMAWHVTNPLMTCTYRSFGGTAQWRDATPNGWRIFVERGGTEVNLVSRDELSGPAEGSFSVNHGELVTIEIWPLYPDGEPVGVEPLGLMFGLQAGYIYILEPQVS